MRLIILNQFYYPDHSATSQLMTDLAESLVARGVAVTALAGRGRYNGGEQLSARETHRGVMIERAWATNYGKRSVFGRLADYLSFYLGATWKLWRLPRHDIVMALTTPPLIALIALIIGRLRGMRVVALVQDVYPDVAIALGALPQKGIATRFFHWLNRLTLRGANRIVVLGECMRERIAAIIGDDYASSPIDVIHNWADGDQIRPLANESNPFVAEHELDEKFVVLFSGNLGRVNEFGDILEAARMLDVSRPDIAFLFIGEGVKKIEIENYARRYNLSNVKLLPYQSREMLRYSLAAGDLSLVTLAHGLAGLSVPSKTYGIFAAGRPVLFIGDENSDIARLVNEHHCGAVVAAHDGAALARMIEELADDRELTKRLGANARVLFDERFDRAHAVDAYLKTFEACLGPATCDDGAGCESLAQ